LKHVGVVDDLLFRKAAAFQKALHQMRAKKGYTISNSKSSTPPKKCKKKKEVR
jgi:hypothetical protein